MGFFAFDCYTFHIMNFVSGLLLDKFAKPKGWRTWTEVKRASLSDSYAHDLYKCYEAARDGRFNANALRKLPELYMAARFVSGVGRILEGNYNPEDLLIEGVKFSPAGKMLFLTDFVVSTPFGDSVLAVMPGLDPETSPFYGILSDGDYGELHAGSLYRTDVFRGYDGYLYWGSTERLSREEAEDKCLSYCLYETKE